MGRKSGHASNTFEHGFRVINPSITFGEKVCFHHQQVTIQSIRIMNIISASVHTIFSISENLTHHRLFITNGMMRHFSVFCRIRNSDHDSKNVQKWSVLVDVLLHLTDRISKQVSILYHKNDKVQYFVFVLLCLSQLLQLYSRNSHPSVFSN